jgi:hypothetical protein
MKKTMKLGLILTVATALCFSVVSVGAAKPAKAADVLPTGGQTIGGPGQFTFTGSSQGIYFTSGSAPYPSICVTVVNTGDLIDVKLESNVVDTVCTLDPGQTVTCCAEKVGAVTLICIDTGGGCNASGFYRLDLRN